MRNFKYSTSRGFSLIELMVAMVVGLIATLVITNVLVTYESQKRTTVGVGDAQTNGAVALYQIQRDAQNAGYGLPVYGSLVAFNCPVDTKIVIDTTTGATIDISAIEVTDGGTGSDTLRIHYGTTGSGGAPTDMILGTTGSVATVNNNIGCAKGDVAFLMSGSTASPTCQMSKVTSVTAFGTTPQTIALDKSTLVGVGNQISCLGTWTEVKYAINNMQLERNDVPIVSGIVNLQVQYGVSSAGNDNTIIQYVNPTGSWDPLTISLANRNRIKAIRLVMVAQSPEKSNTDITAACASNANGICASDMSITVNSNTITSAAPTLNLNGITDWKRYRYRIYDTIIPLRNVIYSKGSEV
jgi:type IV pilus assembly protein PilW